MPLTPPQNREAEDALLGACLLNPAVIGKLNITTQDFYTVRNQWVWEAMGRLARTGANVDPVTLAAELQKAGKLAEAGGPSYITELITRTPSSLHAEDYAAEVRQHAQRRRVLEVCNRLAKAMYSAEPMDAVLAQAMTDLARSAQPLGGARHWSEYLSLLYDEVEERSQNPRAAFGIATGLEDFDVITGGLQRGEMTILSGEPGLGKTLLAMQLAQGMAESKPGAIYEMEMSGRAIVRRAASVQAKVTTRAMRVGLTEDKDFEAFVAAVETLSKLPIYMTDQSELTTTGMRADLARLKETAGVEWFVVDYLDLFSDLPGTDPIERSRFISGAVHGICKDLDLAGLVIHSMNKAGMKDGQKTKAGLSGAAKVIYDADNIILMQHNEDDLAGLITLTWDKQREGDGNGNAMRLWKRKGFPAFAAYKAGGVA